MNNLVNPFGKKQRGVAAVEFALISGLLFSIVFGVVEMGRVIFYVNTAGEATAMGARMAAVCSVDDADIKTRMRQLLPILDSNNDINITYQPGGCSAANCTSVTVEIADGVQINTFIPYIPFTVTLPKFRSQLRRESLNSTNNSLCG